MSAPIPANWPELRAMYTAGAEFQDIARVTGIKEGTIKSRAHREGWTRKATAARTATIKTDRTQLAVDAGQILQHATENTQLNATRPSDSLLSDLGEQSRILGAKAVKNALSHASTLSGEESLAASRPIKDAIGAAAVLHGWQKQDINVGVQVNLGDWGSI